MSTREMEDLPLPHNWMCYTTPEGHKYYVNIFTNETTWTRPPASAGSLESGKSRGSPELSSGSGELLGSRGLAYVWSDVSS
ncbi:growth arrest-specific protein 7-like [Denticeps clupeoides]|uniref:growth arrest-specific protein 7-like n=1 Tax=Denticeps clupeoides TaxID=299321 RepID=UPI0010A509B3|nr:growth arrest-specific protein 7-like [Denticeps clupeoides]